MTSEELYKQNTKPILNGWNLFRFPTIQDGTVFRWTFGGLEISASRNGVSMMIPGRLQWTSRFVGLRETLDDAEFAHEQLKKNNDWDPAMIGTEPVFEVAILGEEKNANLRHPGKVAEFFELRESYPLTPSGWNSMGQLPFTIKEVTDDGEPYRVISDTPLLRLIDNDGGQYVARPADGDLSEAGHEWAIWTGSEDVPLELEEGNFIVGWRYAEGDGQ